VRRFPTDRPHRDLAFGIVHIVKHPVLSNSQLPDRKFVIPGRSHSLRCQRRSVNQMVPRSLSGRTIRSQDGQKNGWQKDGSKCRPEAEIQTLRSAAVYLSIRWPIGSNRAKANRRFQNDRCPRMGLGILATFLCTLQRGCCHTRCNTRYRACGQQLPARRSHPLVNKPFPVRTCIGLYI
jgi:hypothetical protein